MPAAKRPLSPWIKLVMSMWCSGKYHSYGDAMKAAKPIYRKARATGKTLTLRSASGAMKRKYPVCKRVKKSVKVPKKKRVVKRRRAAKKRSYEESYEDW